MKLIIGLGNPGEKYQNTRHNAGFMFVDYLYEHADVVKPWKFDKYSNSEIAEVTLHVSRYTLHAILAKPQTFMNLSGEAAVKLIIHHSFSPEDVCVAHDDLDIKLGEFKMSLGKGPKLHNGISSIEERWKTTEFLRIRIGVDNRSEPISGETYVLSNFTSEEQRIVISVFQKILSESVFLK